MLRLVWTFMCLVPALDCKERLVIYSGRDKDGKSLSIDVQAKLFRSAAAVIGPHGGGMANILWAMGTRPSSCKARVAVLEFICGPQSVQVQPEGM